MINSDSFVSAASELATRELLLLKRPVTTTPTISYLVPAMSAEQKRKLALLVGLWFAVVALFWTWWFEPRHITNGWRYAFNSAALGVAVLLPAYYFFFFSRIRKPNPHLRLPLGHRVAMVVTKTPAEPWVLVRQTLEAMLAQDYPHDTWLADEDPTPETLQWCEQNGVEVSCRKGISEYHRPSWPRRTRCKEGNLAYFYDRFGYQRYEFVVQLDADHRPSEGYLEAMLQPFVDSDVGYVSAPSICSANAAQSWTARGRLGMEAPLHGALQAGYNGAFAPLCIGSHYAVRTCALRDIGGLGPELAEDHSTTLLFNAAGWKGVHALDAEAIGEGPESFADFVTQEFQWAKSLTKILLTLTPRHLAKLPLKLKFQFLFSQCWYLLLSFMMLVSVGLPIVAIFTNEPFVRISYGAFLLFSSTLAAVLIGSVLWIRHNGWCRPRQTKLVSWETVLVQFARWPWILLGIVAAGIDVIRGRNCESFRVTPKGGRSARAFRPVLVVPYAVLTFLAGAPVIFVSNANYVSGYYFVSMINSVIYSIAALAIVVLHCLETIAAQPANPQNNA